MSLRKKLESVYVQGYTDGATATHEVWVEVMKATNGIGPVLQERLMSTAQAVCQERYQNKQNPST